MKYGIHLPHAGEQATPALIRRHAERAEDLGLEDVWVSEHIIVPRDKFPRSPVVLRSRAVPHLGRRRDETGEAGNHRAGVADAPSAALGQGTRHAAQFLRGAADPGRRLRLVEGRVRGPGRAVRGTRPAAGRRDRDDARGLVGGPGDVQKPLYPGGDRGDDDDPDAGQPDPALVRRQRRTRVEADDPDRRRMARQRAYRGRRRRRS